ncbi:MAG TPA: hypothetical protein VER96_01230 [Polyangiaceae bacterium]|nr:hypothetical protein [Polyangiaceae bacterium]
MKRTATPFALIVLGLFTPACGLFASAQTSAPVASSEPSVATRNSRVPDAAPADPRRVGDFQVHRFSGNYQKAPLTLTEEVIARENGLWVIDYTFEEQSGTTKLRVRFDPQTDSVRRVSKFDGSQEHSVPIATYEKLIERTTFAADSNDGMLASTRGTCLVGPSELDCETKSYKVAVGDKAAILNVSRSNSVPGGDVAGDIIGSDGSVIYRSELIEMGNATTPKRDVASR